MQRSSINSQLEKYKFIALPLIEYVYKQRVNIVKIALLLLYLNLQYHINIILGILTKECYEVYDFFCQFISTVTEGNQEICYFTIMLSPAELVKATSYLFSFHLKLRKYIYANIINERETKVKPLNSQIILRLMGFCCFQIDGQHCHQFNWKQNWEDADEKSKDKILNNSVRPLDLLIYCQELQTQRLLQQPQQRQVATFLPEQQHDEEMPLIQTVQPIQQQQKNKQQIQPDLQTKMKEVVLIHENLASNYNKLAIFCFAQQAQALLYKVLTQIRNDKNWLNPKYKNYKIS
ncbi:unnamed protein product (macronuclear) [Paramecium tetraurelia]|uniref:Uncharacterized protein n=1 Tax=Paramecium tetraurelia TaxID=5888 RepID=A0CTK4_PARTE|nr:uncharacterized protein GSPATT00010355001 [Paramecium tetraurelia]CAK74121.1 unnamed protein product [Paramecium tetraurelia]|eukprot:XP_001441518.1 hypothetical protein (macronuclear) [Paramecium tetraurelia strain d4-2]